MAIIQAQAWECDVCGYIWLKVSGRMPTHCPNRKCRSRKWNSKPIGREAMEAVMGDARQFVQSSTPVGKPIYLKRPKCWLAADNTLHALDCKCLMCKPPK